MKIRKLYVLAIVCCAPMFRPAEQAQEAPHPGHTWDYSEAHGPAHWGELEPDFAACKNGHHQSPIDIRKTKKVDLPPILFDYKPSPLDIIDNGHTIMINYAPGSSISIGGKQYALKQFHFHRPSEEKINGKGFEMTIHLVHADREGKLAVVAVLLEKGSDNALLRELWNHLPNQKEKEQILYNIQIDAASLLPSDHSYYTFSGSLTTLPCSEDVTWFVLKQPLSLSNTEAKQFSKLYRNDARPTQPLNDRVVLESK